MSEPQMIKSKLHPIIGSLMLMSLLSVELENASAQTASSEQRLGNPLAPFAELLDGKWIADEKQVTSEGRGYYPQITYESWFDNKVIMATMHHLFDNGHEEMKWKAFNVWHPQKQKIVHYGFWANSMLIEGEFAEIMDGNRLNSTLTSTCHPEAVPISQPNGVHLGGGSTRIPTPRKRTFIATASGCQISL